MSKFGPSKILSEADFIKALDVASNSWFKSRNVCLLYFSLGLGLRAKEISLLTIGDVADETYQPLEKINIKPSIRSSRTKGRQMHISNPKVYGALAEHLKSIAGIGLDKPLFCTQRMQAFSPDILQKWFKKIYLSANIIGASSHSGRKTFITRLLEKGIDIKTVAILAGHSSVATTARYAEEINCSLKTILKMDVF